MDNPLISVIVPVYNVEKYLDRCVESIVNQTYQNLEIILVDDGSPDNCPAMCDEWAKKDSRIVVIHKENGGLSDARNAGLDVFNGQWVLFFDSDDTVDLQIIKLLYQAVTKNDVKLAVCGMNVCYDDGRKCAFNIKVNGNTIKADEYLEHFYDFRGSFIVAWNKLFHRSLFNEFRFKKGIIFEDAELIYKIAFLAGEVSIVDKPLYNYFQTPDSLSRSSFNQKKLSIVDTLLEQKDFFAAHQLNKCYKNNLEQLIYRSRSAAIASLYYLNNKILFRKYYKIFRKAYFEIIKLLAPVSKREMIRYTLFLIFPRGFVWLTKDKYSCF